MATYIKGAQSYGREIKPFTPDYKFLSNALGTMQNRYDSNYKQLNDQYSKVVYADVSREDTQNIRDQYTQKLIPEMEKLSGLDLSLRQNVDAAQGLFKPFYENDLIIKDMVFTSAFKKNSQLAEILKKSDDSEQRKKYWDIGMKGMEYQMQDFLSADREGALRMGLPQYVENVDLYSMGMKILEDAGFKDVEIQMPPKKGDPFIVTKKNGDLRVPGAYNYLMNTLKKDPRVLNAYRTSGLVNARSFAENGMANGLYSSIEEGKSVWAQNTLNEIRNRNQTAHPIIQAKYREALEVKNNWENYQKEEGIIEGGQEEIAMLKALEEFDSAEEKLNNSNENLQRFQTSSESEKDLNFAYSMLMDYNISNDILGAAIAFSDKDKSIKIDVNQYTLEDVKFSHSKSLKKLQASLNRDAALLQGRMDGKIDKDGNIIAETNQYDADDIFAMSGISEPTPFTTVKKEGTVLENNIKDRALQHEKLKVDQIDAFLATESLKNSNKKIFVQNGLIAIKLHDSPEGKPSYLTPEKVKTELMKPENSNALLDAMDATNNYLETVSEKDPRALNKPEYKRALNLKNRIEERIDLFIAEDNLSNKIILENWEAAKNVSANGLKNVLENKKIPSFIDEKGAMRTPEEFEKLFIEAVKNDPDNLGYKEYPGLRNSQGKPFIPWTQGLSKVFQGLQKADDYLNANSYPVGYKKIIDLPEAKDASLKEYKRQKEILNRTFDGTYTNMYDKENIGLFKPYSAKAVFMGKDINDLEGTDLETYHGGITETFTVNNFNNNEDVRNQIKQFSTQIEHLKSRGELKTISTYKDPTLEKDNDEIASEIIRQVRFDMFKTINNPKGQNNLDLVVGLTYRPAQKTDPDSELQGAWTVSLTDDYLKNFQSDNAKTPQGKLNAEQIKKYNEITVVFPTTLDINPAKAGNYNVAATDARINMSDDNSYYYKDVEKTAGSFRIYKENDTYYRIADYIGVNPKNGELENIGQENKVYLYDASGQPATKNNIDLIVADTKNKMINISEANVKLKKQIKEKNKTK